MSASRCATSDSLAPPGRWETAGERLRCGQAHEARGEFPEALRCYDDAIAALQERTLGEPETRRALGVAWMNCGNVRQKIAGAAEARSEVWRSAGSAAAAYDEAISLLRSLPSDVPAYRNHLGAAWLNRGHAFIGTDDGEAVRSFEHSIALLAELPLEKSLSYRLNLAGAWTNLAHVQIATSPACARVAANKAVKLVAQFVADDLASAEMSLRARRAGVMALGELLCAAESAGEPIDALASEASDSVEDGLALARSRANRDGARLQQLALRLFYLGAQVYRRHQPQFLAEFLLENLAPAAFGRVAEFRAVASGALAEALGDLRRPQLLVVGTSAAERAIGTARSLRAAQDRISALASHLVSTPAA